MVNTEKNEKYEAYKAMKVNLKKAMKEGFYYQAIFIEYAIIEDRCLSVLKQAGVKTTDGKGFEIKLSTKLNKIRSNAVFADKYLRKRLDLQLIDKVESGKRERDILIHALAKKPYDNEEIRDVAEQGLLLTNELDKRVKSANNYLAKRDGITADKSYD